MGLRIVALILEEDTVQIHNIEKQTKLLILWNL